MDTTILRVVTFVVLYEIARYEDIGLLEALSIAKSSEWTIGMTVLELHL